MLVVVGAVDVWWLDRFRRGFPLDIDESGYLWFSFNLQDAARANGLSALWHGFQHEGWVAPLLPVVTTAVGLAGAGKGIVPSLAVQLVFFAVLVFASYGIGTRLHSRAAGALTALAVGALPAVTDFVRTYHLVIPSTAMLTFSALALIASNRFRHRGWTIAWGVGLGLTLLARSMMLAFVPGLLLAAIWIAAIDRVRGRRLLNVGIGFAAFGGTSLLWYATSWDPILDYLLRAGYGSDSGNYGQKLSALSGGYWSHEATRAIQGSLYLPLTLVVVAAFIAAAAVAIATHRPWTLTRAALVRAASRALRSDELVLVFAVVEGYLALTSSSNDGTGFVVPLLPSLVALSVVVAMRLSYRPGRVALVVGFVSVSLFNIFMKADIVAAASRVRDVAIPAYVTVPVTNGQGFVQQNLGGNEALPMGSPTHWFPDGARNWSRVYEDVAEDLAGMKRPWLYVDFAPQEPVLNTSALRLYANRAGFVSAAYAYVDSGGNDTVPAYRRFLSDAHPDVVVTTDRPGVSYGPAATPVLVERAARSLGYDQTALFDLPDGRHLRLWTREHS
jgi:hypothetical protein